MTSLIFSGVRVGSRENQIINAHSKFEYTEDATLIIYNTLSSIIDIAIVDGCMTDATTPMDGGNIILLNHNSIGTNIRPYV